VKRWALFPLALSAIVCSVPWLLTQWPEAGFALQRGFALVCHQHPERSFTLFGGSVAVCARCLGIYLGASTGLLVRISRQAAWRWLVAAATISLLDWLAELGGIHGNWMAARFVLGLALGATAARLVIASIDKVKIPTQAKAA
jgi:uncharacterized membrane protein